jgi:predicted RNA-binding protein with PIN domain
VAERRDIWIVDGHNMIFALPRLAELQEQGARSRAREQLAALLRTFTGARRSLTIVYDGNRQPPDPEARDTPLLRILFSHPPETADDCIVALARAERERGVHVTVVTNDRRSLIPRLPAGVETLTIETLRRRLTPRRRSAGVAEEKRLSPPEAEALAAELLARSDGGERIGRSEARQREREARERWLARSGHRPRDGEAARERPRRPPERRAATLPAAAPSGGVAAGPPAPARGTPDAGEGRAARAAREREVARQRKRERGRRKQQRRLAHRERARSRGARRRAGRKR